MVFVSPEYITKAYQSQRRSVKKAKGLTWAISVDVFLSVTSSVLPLTLVSIIKGTEIDAVTDLKVISGFPNFLLGLKRVLVA